MKSKEASALLAMGAFFSRLRCFFSSRRLTTAVVEDRPVHSPAAEAQQQQEQKVEAEHEAEHAEVEQAVAVEVVERSVVENGDIQAALDQADSRSFELERLRKIVAEQERALRQKQEIMQNYPVPEYLQAHVSKVNIAVTGGAGVGKSSFINAVLGDSVASTDAFEECTDRAQHFEISDFKWRACLLWDLPGGGTRKFPSESYVRDLGIRHFDILLVLCDHRFREPDAELMVELARVDMPYMAVRTKMDHTIGDEKRRRPGIAEEETVRSAKEALMRRFNLPFVYAIDSGAPDKFDFQQLLTDLFAALIVRRSTRYREDEECPVCLESFSDRLARRMFGECGHVFCEPCEGRLQVCPICRSGRGS